jgi:hypothetical protein
MVKDETVTETKDKNYDLISTLYHALQGATTTETYLKDAQKASDHELAKFLTETKESYQLTIDRAKELLAERLG